MEQPQPQKKRRHYYKPTSNRSHNRLIHEFLMAKEERPQCETCGEILTIKHIVTEFRRNQTDRINLNISENIDTSHGPNPIQSEAIIKFLKTTDLYKQI